MAKKTRVPLKAYATYKGESERKVGPKDLVFIKNIECKWPITEEQGKELDAIVTKNNKGNFVHLWKVRFEIDKPPKVKKSDGAGKASSLIILNDLKRPTILKLCEAYNIGTTGESTRFLITCLKDYVFNKKDYERAIEYLKKDIEMIENPSKFDLLFDKISESLKKILTKERD